MRIAVELETLEKQARAGTVTTTQFRKVLSDVSERVNGDPLSNPSVEQYLGDWLKGIAVRNSPATLERYKCTTDLLIRHLGARAKKPIAAVTPTDVERFLTWRLESGVAPKTAIIDIKILSGAFRRAENLGTILKNPVAAVRPPREDSSEREVFNHEEVKKLFEEAPTLEWQTLILLGYFTGARLRDCVQMKWDNILADKGALVYQQHKTGKQVFVPLHYNLIEHLRYLSKFSTEGFLCPKLAMKGPGGKHGLSESFKRIMVKAKVDPMKVQGKGIRMFNKRTFHSLRHSFNSELANSGISEEVRMKLTGHRSKPMNKRYTHLEVATLKSAVNALPLFSSAKLKKPSPPSAPA
jgi:integrase